MNTVRRSLRLKAVCVALVAALIVGSLDRGLHAMMVPADQAITVSKGDRAADLRAVQTALENKVVQQRLKDFGLSPEEVNARLARLTDEQIHQVARQSNIQNPAGDTSGILLVAAALVLFVVLIVMFLKKGIDDDDDDDDKIQTQTAPAPAAPAAPGDAPDTIIVK